MKGVSEFDVTSNVTDGSNAVTLVFKKFFISSVKALKFPLFVTERYRHYGAGLFY